MYLKNTLQSHAMSMYQGWSWNIISINFILFQNHGYGSPWEHPKLTGRMNEERYNKVRFFLNEQYFDYQLLLFIYLCLF